MKHYFKILFFIFVTASLFGCKKFLDVNADPVNPQVAPLASLLPPVQGNIAFAASLDNINIGQLVQFYSHASNVNNNSSAAPLSYDFQGGNLLGSPGPNIWRRLYLDIGVPLNQIIERGTNEELWDYVGAAFAMKAWAVQYATDMCGEMPLSQAWQDKIVFDYDTQQDVYKSIDSMLRQAVFYLSRTDGKVSQNQLRRGDQVYNGSTSRWLRFTYGLMARRFHRLTNKQDYSADSVIKYVDLALQSGADNFYVPYTATRNDDSNPYGSARSNFFNTASGSVAHRYQSRYIVQLLDGTNFFGANTAANRDPRISRMLTASADTSTNGGYRFVVPGVGDPNVANVTAGSTGFRQRVSLPYADSTPVNFTGSGNFGTRIGKYIFQNSAPFCLMAYHELQFIKAEAALRKSAPDRALAYTAYLNGVNAHFDFVNFFSSTASPTVQPISSSQRSTYLASAGIAQNSSALTLTDVMLQKYIGDYGWNSLETWCDMRRYHYIDVDQITGGAQVYRGFTLPTTFHANNLGPKPQYRFWPTNVSELDWNREALRKVGGLNIDYHTYEMWFSQP